MGGLGLDAERRRVQWSRRGLMLTWPRQCSEVSSKENVQKDF